MSNAEIMIRENIDNMTTYKLYPTMEEIKKDIKYAFFHEYICKEIYDELMQAVRDKYNSVCDNILA